MDGTFDRVLTRIWIGLASSCLLAGSLHLGAAVGTRPRFAGRDETGCRPAIAGMPDASVPIHWDPQGKWNRRQARP